MEEFRLNWGIDQDMRGKKGGWREGERKRDEPQGQESSQEVT